MMIKRIATALSDLHRIADALERLEALWVTFIAREPVARKVAAAATEPTLRVSVFSEEEAWLREQEAAQKQVR